MTTDIARGLVNENLNLSSNEIRYRCVSCGMTVRSKDIVYRCENCVSRDAGGYQKGILEVENQKILKGDDGYVDPLNALPYLFPFESTFQIGNTPLVQAPAISKLTGLTDLYFKVETTNPSGSYKDRASLLVAVQALYHQEKRIALASTGNAGAASACINAILGLETILFVPDSAPAAKILQAAMYGAKVIPVKGTYDDAYKLSLEYTECFGGINRNTAYNPMTIEGKKTASIEIYNQMDQSVPDYVYIPVGDGVIYSALCKGFYDLYSSGITDKVPKCICVQAEGSAAIVKSWKNGGEIVLQDCYTKADSLSVKSPANGQMTLSYIDKTDGWGVNVSDEEIFAAQKELASNAGLLVDPASAAAFAGLIKDRKNNISSLIGEKEKVVVMLTGTGLKNLEAFRQGMCLPPSFTPGEDDFNSYLKLNNLKECF